MDHKREHRTPPLARVMGVGRQQHVICDRVHTDLVSLSASMVEVGDELKVELDR